MSSCLPLPRPLCFLLSVPPSTASISLSHYHRPVCHTEVDLIISWWGPVGWGGGGERERELARLVRVENELFSSLSYSSSSSSLSFYSLLSLSSLSSSSRAGCVCVWGGGGGRKGAILLNYNNYA